MAEWMFLVAGHYGGRQQRRELAQYLGRVVAQEGLSSIFPLVKYEIGKHREYYLGLAYDTRATLSEGSPEQAVRRILDQAGISTTNSWSLSPEDVRTLLRGTPGGESFSIPIQFERREHITPPSANEILAALTEDSSIDSDVHLQTSLAHLNLLYWCSTVGGGSLSRILQAGTELGLVNEHIRAWSLLRRLVLLGHVEFDGGSALDWGMVPPVLVTPDLDSSDRLLVGQRTPSLVDQLCNRFNVEETVQRNGPSRIIVRGISDQQIEDCFPSLIQTGNAARKLVSLLPDIDSWLQQLPTWDEQDVNRFACEQYLPELDRLTEVDGPTEIASGAMYRFTHESHGRRIVTIAFRETEPDRWVSGDYYGMRFLARQRAGLCRAIYSCQDSSLVVPASDRWPMPYERALVLASGLLPQLKGQGSEQRMLQYDGITRELAAQLCTLLNLQLEVVQCTT